MFMSIICAKFSKYRANKPYPYCLQNYQICAIQQKCLISSIWLRLQDNTVPPSSRSRFLIEKPVEKLVEPGFVSEQYMDLFQVIGVVAPRNPYFQIAI